MASWELDGDGEPNDGKGVIVVQGWMVRKGRIPGFITTFEDHLQGAKIHAADFKFARQKWRGVFNRRQYFPDRRNRQDSCKSGVTFGEGIELIIDLLTTFPIHKNPQVTIRC